MGRRWRSTSGSSATRATRGGREVDTQGDAFFFAFAHAKDAVEAAAAAQRALAVHAWPDGAHLRARIGLHTGQASVTDSRYVGLSVHRAARVMGAAPVARCCSRRRPRAFSRTTISASSGCARSAVTRSRTSTVRWSCISSTCPACLASSLDRRPSRRRFLDRGSYSRAVAAALLLVTGCRSRSDRARRRRDHRRSGRRPSASSIRRPIGSSTRYRSARRRR